MDLSNLRFEKFGALGSGHELSRPGAGADFSGRSKIFVTQQISAENFMTQQISSKKCHDPTHLPSQFFLLLQCSIEGRGDFSDFALFRTFDTFLSSAYHLLQDSIFMPLIQLRYTRVISQITVVL